MQVEPAGPWASGAVGNGGLRGFERREVLVDLVGPHVVVGLSNLSQGASERGLINRTFLVMGIGCGLDASIHDPLDEEMTNAMITAELLLNKTIYSDSYLSAYRQGKQRL